MSIEDSAATRLFTVADAAENASAELRTKHEIKFDNCHFELSLRQFYVKMKGVQTLTIFCILPFQLHWSKNTLCLHHYRLKSWKGR